jgi:hypothetical protein
VRKRIRAVFRCETKPRALRRNSPPALAHDTHEGMTILADAYDEPARAKEKFGKADPIQVGILPVEVFLRNESGHPIRIDLNTIQLVVHFRNGQIIRISIR